MAQIFVSYSRQDSQFVLQHLVDALTQQGYQVWIDRASLVGGEEWFRTLAENLQTCPVFVVVLSPQSMASEQVAREIALAEKFNKPIIPVLYQECRIPPALARLEKIQWIDFVKMPFPWAVQKLGEALSQYRVYPAPPKPVPPPPPPDLSQVVVGSWYVDWSDRQGAAHMEITLVANGMVSGNFFRPPQMMPWLVSGTWRVDPPSQLVLQAEFSALQVINSTMTFFFTNVARNALQGFALPDRLPCAWRRM